MIIHEVDDTLKSITKGSHKLKIYKKKKVKTLSIV